VLTPFLGCVDRCCVDSYRCVDSGVDIRVDIWFVDSPVLVDIDGIKSLTVARP
jgi:hypothetical protein